jgi:hypothetical protein
LAEDDKGHWESPKPPVPEAVIEGSNVRGKVTFHEKQEAIPQSKLRKLKVKPKLKLNIAGTETKIDVKMSKVGAGFEFEWTAPPVPAGQGALEINASLSLKWKGGETEPTTTTVRVSPDVCIKAQEAIVFGNEDTPVVGGCKATAHCQALNFDGSRNLRPGGRLKIVYLEGDKEVSLSVRQAGEKLKYLQSSEGHYVEVDDTECRQIQLCFIPKQNCGFPSGKPKDWSTTIAVRPAGLADAEERGATVTLRARVEPTDFWGCYGAYILMLLGALTAWYVWRGFVSPNNFTPGATVRCHMKESKLGRAPAAGLSGVPDGRRGWYRNATCSFDAGGNLVRRGKGILSLEAGPGGTILIEVSGCQLRKKARGRWKDVDPTGKNPDAEFEKDLQSGSTYDVNESFCFKIDF